jgi:hypothetical protein
MAGFCISGVELFVNLIISEMALRQIVCEDGRWMELAQDHVQRWALILVVLNRLVLLPEIDN